ncbi:MAG: MFS transporter [Phycisphaerales bacterium]
MPAAPPAPSTPEATAPPAMTPVNAAPASDAFRWRMLPLHALALMLMQGTFSAVQFTVPVFVKKQLAPPDWQVTILTAAPLVLAAASIFWHAVLQRVSLRTYMALYWLVSSLPLIAIAFADAFWPIAISWIGASAGFAAMSPIMGEMLRRFYPPGRRGLAYSLVGISQMLAAATASELIGRFLQRDAGAVQWILPGVAGLQLLGAVVISLIAGREIAGARAGVGGSILKNVIEPVLHTGEVLRGDRLFARYEAAFMTYGAGWMIICALIPLIITNKLQLTYDEAPTYSHVVFLIACVLLTVPAGFMIDRMGAARMCTLSFAVYAALPLLLIFANSKTDLAVAHAVYGIAAAGVNTGWMLGPVALAPSPAKVPQYVAIHTTMVGIRGALFQGLGVLIYTLSGDFTWPLVLAALSFAWAAWQMWALRAAVAERTGSH